MKLLLIDDHPLILSALQAVAGTFGHGAEVIGAESAAAARAVLARDADVDLVLLDLNLGDVDGFDLLAEFRAAHPALPVVVLSASERPGDVIRAIDAGAMGFVPKRASNDALFDAVRLVMSGGIYVPPMPLAGDPAAPTDPDTLTGALTAETRPAPLGGAFPGRVTELATPGWPLSHARTPVPPPIAFGGARSSFGVAAGQGTGHSRALASLGLTPRQSEVLGLLLKGQSNKLIARELGLSVETVKDHVAAVMRALGVHSRTQAVVAVGQLAAAGHAPGDSWRQPA